MINQLLIKAEKYNNKHRQGRKRHQVVSVLACIVVFITTYMLILPAITMEQTAYCGMEEHHHSSECSEVQLICGYDAEVPSEPASEIDSEADEEGEPEAAHVHSGECYVKKMVCGLEEHEHSLACFSNPDADTESRKVWERSVSDVELTGVWADDLVAVAESQLGYKESTENYIVTKGGKIKGITRYGQWYGDDYGDWCAMFVSFCLNYADIPESHMPQEASCERWIELLSKQGFDSYRSAGTYFPEAGDIIFFDLDEDESADHVGIVAEISEENDDEASKIKVIEGNSSNRVQYVKYETDDTRILGYGELPENPGDLEKDSDFELKADSVNGVSVRISGPESSLPFPEDEITVTVEAVKNDNAAALVDAAVADTELENGLIYLFDVCLWHEDKEIEPAGPVMLTFEGVASAGENETAGVFHVDEDNEEAAEMSSELNDDGTIVVDTDHFSLYGVVVAGGGTFAIDYSINAVWDTTNEKISSLTFTASNSSKDKVTYRVEYSDDGGSTWVTAVTSSETGKNKSASMEAVTALDDAPPDRIFRVYGTKDKKNYGYTASVTLDKILDSVKQGFSDWLENSYVQDFGGSKIPENQRELYDAFSVYYALPSLTIETRMDGNTMYVDANTDYHGENLGYAWQYKDENGNWVSLGEYNSASINASSIELLLDGGKNVRCILYENNAIKAVSSTLFVNPMRQAYDDAIEAINSGLSLGDLEINGKAFNDYFYYGNVARDSRVPFSDAESYGDYLARTYLAAGGGSAGLASVQEEWDKYLYDLYDPNPKGNTSDYPEYTYGDNNLEWPKDSTSSFHGTLSPVVDNLNYDFLENGVDYSNFVSGLDKTATAVKPGDENTERKYNIDITADAQAKADGPVAMILQIQTSWQMFDMNHANAVSGDGATKVGSVSNNTELANLYDIKQALLRFVDYMETNYPGNNLVIGITEVQHAKSQTMFSGTDSSGNSLYVSNNYNILRQSIRDWDSFGNCEHVHYDTNALTAAATNLSSNLYGWKDFYGQEIEYEDIQKTAVIIGGPTENDSGTNGYGCTLPWTTFQSTGMNSVYGIRTNNGTSNGSGLISWLDYSGNNTGAAFVDGTGTSFTEKYVATTEDAVFNTLVRIAKQEMRKNGIEITAEDKYVENVKVSDTVSDEFALDWSEPITATVYNKDGSVYTQKTVSADDPDLSIVENADGTTSVSYNFGTVYNTKKCTLHFGIQAKEDYIGSNNVYSNIGTPYLTYDHKKLDSFGNPTGEEQSYEVDCYDTPQVNVPIRFNTTDGEKTSIVVGDKVNLADLSTVIAQNAEDLVDNYDQINGTLSYTWVLPDGTEIDAGSVDVSNGSIGPQSFPDRSYEFTGTDPGQYVGTLKVTFTPEAVDNTGKNFSDTDTAVAVNPLTKPGNVWINVVSSDSTERFFVRKEWTGGPPEDIDSVKFRILSGGEPVCGEDGKVKEYELSAASGWETEITGLPSVKDGAVQNYTVEEINPPEGYQDTYSSESIREDEYRAKAALTFTPKDNQDNKKLKITYRYNGVEYTYTTPKGSYKKDQLYTFYVDNLPLNEGGEPYTCAIVSIVKDDDGKTVELTASSANTEKYHYTTVNTEIKVITNTPAYILPETGGTGTSMYITGGLLFMIISGILLLYNHIRRRKEGSASS